MKWTVRAMLFAAALGYAGAGLAADKKPVPSKPPIRVPFSKFRTKPIIEMHSDDSPFKDTNSKKPITVKILPKQKPVEVTKITEKPPVPEENDEHAEREAQFAGNVPIPARKPGTATPDSIIAMPATSREEHPPTVGDAPAAPQKPDTSAHDAAVAEAKDQLDPDAAADAAVPDADVAYVPPRSDLIDNALRKEAGRFGDDRTAGTGFGARARDALRMVSINPRDLRAMLAPEPNGAISPILLPGYTETVAAPDAAREDEEGIPSQVIVFFQEGSPKMEVGQIDVLNADVLERMQDYPDLHLEIVGFSEKLESGEDETHKMAAIRAAELRDYLKSHKISSDRLTVTAKGDDTEVEPRDRVEMYFSR